MSNQFVTKIIKLLQSSDGLEVSDITNVLGIKRTNLQYHLKYLLEDGLIKRVKSGKAWKYFASEDRVISKYFDNQIKELESQKKEIISINKIKPSSRKDLILTITNYYDLLDEDRKELEKYYTIQDYSDKDLIITQKEFMYRAKDSDVLLANWPCDITEEMIADLPDLKYIHSSAYMYSYIDLNALQKRGIHFSHVPFEYKSIALTEYILAQTFALLRPTIKASNQVRSGITSFENFEGEQLRGKTVGIIGTDYITKDLINILRSFGTDVKICSFEKTTKPDTYGMSKFTEYKELIKNSDILFLASRVNEEASRMNLDKKFLENLYKPTYIVSIGKPDYIDYGALRDSIYSGKVKGIAMDFVNELVIPGELDPKTNGLNKILYLPNVIITPDIGWYTKDAVRNLNKYTTEALVNYAKGNDRDLLF